MRRSLPHPHPQHQHNPEIQQVPRNAVQKRRVVRKPVMSNTLPDISPPSAMPSMVHMITTPTWCRRAQRGKVLAHDDRVAGGHDAALEQTEQRRIRYSGTRPSNGKTASSHGLQGQARAACAARQYGRKSAPEIRRLTMPQASANDNASRRRAPNQVGAIRLILHLRAWTYGRSETTPATLSSASAVPGFQAKGQAAGGLAAGHGGLRGQHSGAAVGACATPAPAC